MDTTLRDGEQTQGVSFAPAEKLGLAQALLARLNVDRIEVASAGVSQGEQQAVRQINEWAAAKGHAGQVEVLGFVDGQRSVDWIVGAGGQVINLLTKGSENHCLKQLRHSPQQHIERILETIAYAQEHGLTVNVYFEDWSNGYRDKPEYVYQLTDALADSGIARFMLPDTLGVMSPQEVGDSIGDMVSRYPALHFDFHPHNDYGLATANVMAAVAAGAKGIHCTVNCLGERAGNASLAEVAVVLKDKMGAELSIDERHIIDISQMVESFSGKFVAGNAPILGSDVFTQTAGIHADGDKKAGLYETHLSPERFARKRAYALGKMAGKASLEQNLDALGISLAPDDQAKVLARVIELGDSKQTITPEDLPFIIASVLESSDLARLTLEQCKTYADLSDKATVDITVNIDGKSYSEHGTGNGAYDAFTDALDKILAAHTNVQRPTLVDYEVHIPRGGRTDALTEAAITWQLADNRRITTRGVHSNQVFAAIQATLRVINMLLN
ncbi:MAG: 2-isopropylmalate synthase [Gammaproteobacteria bacterium]|nr:2-isopropylmalate synthase [Gammaproteobacteria bacterium]